MAYYLLGSWRWTVNATRVKGTVVKTNQLTGLYMLTHTWQFGSARCFFRSRLRISTLLTPFEVRVDFTTVTCGLARERTEYCTKPFLYGTPKGLKSKEKAFVRTLEMVFTRNRDRQTSNGCSKNWLVFQKTPNPFHERYRWTIKPSETSVKVECPVGERRREIWALSPRHIVKKRFRSEISEFCVHDVYWL